MRAGLFAWRRLSTVKRYVKGGVGGLEPKYSAAPVPRWLVHAHLIVDATADADFGALEKAWSAATAGKGRLLVPPKLGADVRDPLAAASYITKHVDWCPRPGALPENTLRALFQHTRGRRMYLSWGTGRGY